MFSGLKDRNSSVLCSLVRINPCAMCYSAIGTRTLRPIPPENYGRDFGNFQENGSFLGGNFRHFGNGLFCNFMQFLMGFFPRIIGIDVFLNLHL